MTSHVERDLGRHLASVSGAPPCASADLWAALAQACRRAALDGRCDAGPSARPNPSPSPCNRSPNPNLPLALAVALARALAALDGRCDARRVQLLHQLAAVEDFVAFFEMMSTPAPLQLEPVDRPQP